MEALLGLGVSAIVVIVIILVVLALLFGGLRSSILFTVKTQENVIVERFGKFLRVAKPGLNTKIPFMDTLTKPISLRIRQLEVNIESKTKDNVFVTVPVAVQYVIREESVQDAYYRLSNPEAQIRSYVFDTVRSALSGLDLDAAFESKDDIARSVEATLSTRMQEFGFHIVNTLVQDISPDQRVRDSMNSINAAQRDRVAAQSLAEADKIKRVTQAEAEAESKRLQGEGVAAQRRAIAMGIAEQYEMLKQVGIENTAEQLLLMTQYFDTMQDVARNGRSARRSSRRRLPTTRSTAIPLPWRPRCPLTAMAIRKRTSSVFATRRRSAPVVRGKKRAAGLRKPRAALASTWAMPARTSKRSSIR